MNSDYRSYHDDDTVHNMWVDYTADCYEAPADGPLIDSPAVSPVTAPARRVDTLRRQINRLTQRLDSLQQLEQELTSQRKIRKNRERMADLLSRIDLLQKQLEHQQRRVRQIRLRSALLIAVALLVVISAFLFCILV